MIKKKSEEIRILPYRIDYIKKVFIYTNQKYFSKSSCPFSLPSLPFLSFGFSWHHYFSLGSPLLLSFDIVYFPLLFFLACPGSLLLHSLLVTESGGYSWVEREGCSLRWLPLLQSTGSRASVVAACALSSCRSWAREQSLNSCGARTQLLLGMWVLPN